MYGSCAALSGESPDVWQNVSFWKQQSVFSLHWLVRTPSQSMSMSAFQNTAPVLPHTGIVAEVSESVLYLPLEIWLHVLTLASSSAAVGAPPPPVVGGGVVGPPPPAFTTILSKSGAQPLLLKILMVLLPALRFSVTFLVPGVLKLPVLAKLTVTAEPLLTLNDALRTVPLA